MSPNETYLPSTLEAFYNAYATVFAVVVEEGTPGPGADANVATVIAEVVEMVCDDPARYGFRTLEYGPVCKP
jgi:hypothetical protein